MSVRTAAKRQRQALRRMTERNHRAEQHADPEQEHDAGNAEMSGDRLGDDAGRQGDRERQRRIVQVQAARAFRTSVFAEDAGRCRGCLGREPPGECRIHLPFDRVLHTSDRFLSKELLRAGVGEGRERSQLTRDFQRARINLSRRA